MLTVTGSLFSSRRALVVGLFNDIACLASVWGFWVILAYMPGSPQLGFFAAGFLEGYVTSQSICDFAYDFETVTFDGNNTLRDVVVTFLRANVEWTATNTAKNNTQYWRQVPLEHAASSERRENWHPWVDFCSTRTAVVLLCVVGCVCPPALALVSWGGLCCSTRFTRVGCGASLCDA